MIRGLAVQATSPEARRHSAPSSFPTDPRRSLLARHPSSADDELRRKLPPSLRPEPARPAARNQIGLLRDETPDLEKNEQSKARLFDPVWSAVQEAMRRWRASAPELLAGRRGPGSLHDGQPGHRDPRGPLLRSLDDFRCPPHRELLPPRLGGHPARRRRPRRRRVPGRVRALWLLGALPHCCCHPPAWRRPLASAVALLLQYRDVGDDCVVRAQNQTQRG
ncbi:hypothetical protein DFJ74DRAFT_670275 [Hyaloraphidium curvatum]|nr:hypothetical protein DFJ74DRAFT_670275 [Hyaloraphidium curvatum]